MFASLALTAPSLTLVPGCNLSRLVARNSGPLLKGTLDVLNRSEDPEFARQAAPGLIVLLEGLLAQDPENKTLLELLCRGSYEYAFAYLQRPWEQLRQTEPARAERFRHRARAHYLKVYRLGLRLLALRGVKIDLGANDKEAVQKRIERIEKKKLVPALVWTAVGAGGALLTGLDKPKLMQLASKIPILLEKAKRLDPEYSNALPDAALGMFWARPRMLGGSATRSQRHFAEAIRLTNRRYLMWLVLYANTWAWQFQSVTRERLGVGATAKVVPVRPLDKRKLFVSLLDEVRRQPIEAKSPHRLANTLAKQLAEALYAKKDEFLGAAPPPTPPPTKSRPAPPARRPGGTP